MSAEDGGSTRVPGVLGPTSAADVDAAMEARDEGRLRWALCSLPVDEALAKPTATVFGLDSSLKATLNRLTEALADQGRLDKGAPHQFGDIALTLLLAPSGGLNALVGTYLVDDPALSAHHLELLAAAPMAPGLRVEAFCRCLGRLDDADSQVDTLAKLIDTLPEDPVENALLTARPETPAGCEKQWRLLAAQLDGTGWIPDHQSLLELVDAWTAVLWSAQSDPDAPRAEAAAFLGSLALDWERTRHERAAAVAWLTRLRLAPGARVIGRAVSAAYYAADRRLLDQVIAAADWTAERIAPDEADFFITAVRPVVGDLRARGDDRGAARLVELAEACASSTSGPLSADALKHLAAMKENPPQLYGIRELLAHDAVFWAIWGWSNFTAGTHEAAPRVSAAQAYYVGWDEGMYQRHGPLAVLLLADLAIELGDLAHARAILKQAQQIYPRHSTVLAQQRKLARHVRDERRCDEILDELARLWESDGDDSGAHAQVNLLTQLKDSRGRRLAEMRARELLDDPRFAQFTRRLEELAG